MSKELVALLKNKLRMPWELHLRPGKYDEMSHNHLGGKGGFSREYLKVPTNESAMVQAIALPTILMAIHADKPGLEPIRELWDKGFTKEEKQLIVRHYGLRDAHRFVMMPVIDATKIRSLASSIGACFTYTFGSPSCLHRFGDMVDAAVAFERGEPSILPEMKTSPLLILTGVLGRYPNSLRVDGAIYDVLMWRMDAGYSTVMIETPPSAQALKAIMRGQFSPEMYEEEFVQKTEIGKTRIGTLLAGLNTYVYTGATSRKFNDNRFEMPESSPLSMRGDAAEA